MALNLTVVQRATDGTAIALAALSRAKQSCDLLEPIHVVVPTVGMREWLIEQVMRHDAASFGVVMNIKFHFIGDLHRNFQKLTNDPWALDRQVSALLSILGGFVGTAPAAKTFVKTSRGLLPAADRLAQLFDRYVSRRPRMMHQWESGHATDGSGTSLAAVDEWQFAVWSVLRKQIGVTPTLLVGSKSAALPSHLLMFGIETLDERTLAALQAMSSSVAIEVVAIHPSPLLASRWDVMHPPAADAKFPPPPRVIHGIPRDLLDQQMMLPYRWLRASEEMQMTLARAGLGMQGDFKDVASSQHRLGRIQRIVAMGSGGLSPSSDSADPSIVLHRCHGLARQAEVAVDAIVQALNESAVNDTKDKRLQLHEIAIMSPNIKRIAPHLRAAFDREIVLSNKTKCKIPLRLADLNLGDIDDGARLFIDFLELVGGRLDLDSVLALLSDPALAKSRKLGPEALQRWELHLGRAQQRWGLDAKHRKASFKLDITVNNEPDEQHSWLHSARRILLGAAVERGGVDVLLDHGVIPDVETDELQDVLELVEILETIRSVVEERHAVKTATEWAVLLDSAFTQLCGDWSKLTSVPLSQLRRLTSISGIESETLPNLTFDEVSRFLTNQFGVVSDKRLTRTGEVVATGLGAQSHVPYRVICLVGVDDAAMPSSGKDGFDLVSRDNLIGDPDPRHDVRRQILTAVLSAQDRVIITCDGRDLKNNNMKNLAAPLDEFTSWCAQAGEKITEVLHPRHLFSPRNFIPGGVSGANTWSHDLAARAVAEAMQMSEQKEVVAVIDPSVQGNPASPMPQPALITNPEISGLRLIKIRDMLFYPISVFLQWSYNIGFERRVNEIDSNVLSLDLPNKQLASLAKRLMQARVTAAIADTTTDEQGAIKQWSRENRRQHLLPVTEEAKLSAEQLIKEVVESAIKEWRSLSTLALTDFESKKLEIPGASIVIEGDVPTDQTSSVLMVQFDEYSPENEPATDFLMLQLLFYRACGLDVDKIIVVAMTDTFEEYVTKRDNAAKKKTPTKVEACTSFEISWATGAQPTVAQALTWVAALVRLYREAATHPIPTFVPRQKDSQRTTTGHLLYIQKTSEAAVKQFASEVGKPPNEGSSGFAGTNEAIVYGAEPSFDECFPVSKSQTDPKPIEQQFWLDRQQWWTRPMWSAGDSAPQFSAEVELPSALQPPTATQIADSGAQP